MEWSRYTCTRVREGWVAVFHELHPVPLYIRADHWIEVVSEPLVSAYAIELLERKLLVRGAEDDDAELARVKRQLMDKLSVPLVLYLILAQGCNFACGYCPIPRLPEAEQAARLSVEDACAGLSLWAEHLTATPEQDHYIIFYGGEPLLNKATFYASLEEIRRLQEAGRLSATRTHLMLATNGTLIDDEVIAICLERDVLVALGIDGPKRVNDRLRIYADGRGTFDDILGMLQKLQARGVRTAVSASLTPYSLHALRELSELLQSVGVSKFGLNFLKGRAVLELLSESDRANFTQASVAAVLRRHEECADGGYEYQVEKKMKAFAEQDFFPLDCTCYGNQLVIRADGQVSNCPFFNARFGQVRDLPLTFRVWQTDTVKLWRGRSSLEHAVFRGDDTKALSGTGCAWSAIDCGENVLSPDEVTTRFSQAMFERLIWLNWKGDEV
ncbi:radical SAM protein [Patescibacteria group bacterium]|nr:radical SAM protein [Patescibacteria group bacterium]